MLSENEYVQHQNLGWNTPIILDAREIAKYDENTIELNLQKSVYEREYREDLESDIYEGTWVVIYCNKLIVRGAPTSEEALKMLIGKLKGPPVKNFYMTRVGKKVKMSEPEIPEGQPDSD